MRTVAFATQAKKDFEEYSRKNKKTVLKIMELISNINAHPYTGIGKPEPLKHQLAGYWSRRINSKDRLVYKVTIDELFIISCKGHYS